MSEHKAPAINSESLQDVLGEQGVDTANLSLEALVLLVNTERLKFLHDSSHKEFKELKDRQERVSFLNKLLKKINASLSESGELDITNNKELQEMLKKAKGMDVEIKDDGKLKFTKEEKDRLVGNVRITVDDLNVLNDMQLQTINRLTNERYEAYQMARSILKPLHEAKMRTAQGINR